MYSMNRKVQNETKYVIFGAGQNGRKVAKLVGIENVSCFVDNYLDKTSQYGEVPLYSFTEFKNRGLKREERIVISPKSLHAVVEIGMQLEKDGFRWLLPDDVGSTIIAEEARIYESMNARSNFRIHEKNNFYCYEDRFGAAGGTGGYFWMDLWAAKKIMQQKPTLHHDVGSRVDGFISHMMLIGQRVMMIDIRPADLGLDGVDFTQADATNSIESLSALCSPEHFGLGRYGDPIDPEACFKFFSAVAKKMKSGGHVYICVPVGRERVEFNAHRIFSPRTIIESFGENMSLVEFSVTDGRTLELEADKDVYAEYPGHVSGLFEFVKQ